MTIDWSKAPEGYDVHINWGADTGAYFYRDEGRRYVREGGQFASKRAFPREGVVVTLRSVPVSWNGEGKPPVGTVCEVHHETWADDLWETRKVLWIGKTNVVTETASGTELNGLLDKLEFRPIRTAEQVAAQERSKACDAMFGVLMAAKLRREGNHSDICEALYDAGYRKQELTQ